MILKVKYPVITTIPRIANLLAILEVEESEMMIWFTQNYINITFQKQKLEEGAEKYFEEKYFEEICFEETYYGNTTEDSFLLESTVITRVEFEGFQKPIELFIKSQIDKGCYVSLLLNTYYLSISQCYNRMNFNHPCFVYGYDDINRVFNVADFFNGRYICSTVTYDEFVNAYNNYSNADFFLDPRIWVYRRKYSYNKNIKMNPKRIAKLIELYLCGGKYGDSSFGIECYNRIIEHVNNGTFRIKPYHVIYDHKCAMTRRAEYLYELKIINRSTIIDQLRELENMAHVLRNKVLKLQIKNDDYARDIVVKGYLDLKDKEIITLSEFANLL